MNSDDNPKYGVFIIESMDLENEIHGKLDGFVLKQVLDLCGIPNEYFYIRTRLELENIIERFDESNYGFLHIACHGNEEELVFTYDHIDYDELELIIGQSLYNRRMYLSACKAANFKLARHFIPKYHCRSVIGSPDDIDYDKAGVFWGTFYYLMFETNKVSMPQKNLIPVLKNLTRTFSLKLNYYSIIRNGHSQSMSSLKEFNFDSGSIINKRIIDTGFNNVFRLNN